MENEDSNKEYHSLINFFIFDSQVSDKEGSKVDILFFYPSNENESNEEACKKDIESGLCTTFLLLCPNFTRMTPDSDCDYIFTSKREIALLELYDKIYISVSYASSTPTHRHLLKSVLETCRSIFFLNTYPPVRNESNVIPNDFRAILLDIMPQILHVINWDDLVFNMLWHAYIPALTSVSHTENCSLLSRLNDIISKYLMISSLVITFREKVVCSLQCDPYLVRLLSLLVFHKFERFFPYSTKKREDIMRWIIGFINNSGHIELFTPPIIWKGATYALGALQLNKVRVIILIDPQIDFSTEDLKDFSRDILPIIQRIDRLETFNMKKQTIHSDVVGLKVKHSSLDKELSLVNTRVQPYDFQYIETGVLRAHEFSKNCSEGYFPLPSNYHAFFSSSNSYDSITVLQEKKGKGITDGIKLASDVHFATFH